MFFKIKLVSLIVYFLKKSIKKEYENFLFLLCYFRLNLLENFLCIFSYKTDRLKSIFKINILIIQIARKVFFKLNYLKYSSMF